MRSFEKLDEHRRVFEKASVLVLKLHIELQKNNQVGCCCAYSLQINSNNNQIHIYLEIVGVVLPRK